jgi:hypothetical protein
MKPSPDMDRLKLALDNASAPFLAEIVRQSELRLAEQATLARASDQRAASLISFIGAIASAEATIAIAGWSLEQSSLIVGALTSVCGSMVAIAFIACTTLPGGFSVVGNYPSSFIVDLENGVSLSASQVETLVNYETALRANNKQMKSNGVAITTAIFIFLFSIPLSLIAAYLTPKLTLVSIH